MPTVIPVFRDLLHRHDLTRTDVLVYGALAAYERAGSHPRMADMAAALGLSVRKLSARFQRLQERGLLLRSGNTSRGTTQKYQLLGPRLME